MDAYGTPAHVRVLFTEANVVKNTVTTTLNHDDDDGEDYYEHYYQRHLSSSRSYATPCKRMEIPDATPSCRSCKRRLSCEVSPILSSEP